MSETDSAGLSRVCSACGRRVPRKVSVCRCGSALSADEPAPRGTAAPSSTDFAAGFRSAIGVVIALAAIVLGTYWFNRPAPAPTRSQAVAAPAPRANTPAAPAPDLAMQSPAAAPSTERVAPPPVVQYVAPATAAPPVPAVSSLEDVLSQVMPAVVLIETSSGRGSGFYVRPDTLLTNVHVVGSNSSVTIRRADGTTSPARVETKSSAFDIAVLKVSNPVPTQPLIALGSTGSLRVGQEVVAIGSALGTLQNTVTRGIVSAVRQSGNATLVQTDAAVNPGNSGGPLLDRNGAAIGITTMGYSERQGLNFAVGIDHGRALLEGRPAPPPAAVTSGGDDLRSLSPAVQSDTDRMRSEGQRAYEHTLTELARAADRFDAEWRRFRELCYPGRVVGSFDREWFALLAERSMPDGGSPRCDTYLSDIRRDAGTFRDAMVQAEESARRAGVYPGTRRDALRQHRLDFEGWGR